MKPTPELINAALSALAIDQAMTTPTIFTKSGATGEIPNRYKGYISSFGGSIVQLGIMPACMAMIADSKKATLANMLFDIYRRVHHVTFVGGLDEYLKANWQAWQGQDRKRFRKQMTSIAVSMKLAMRTYKFDESESI